MSINQTPTGNAWAISLPIGTRLVLLDPKEIEAIAYHEVQDGYVVRDVVLVSKSYLIERDERELRLINYIERLKLKYGVP